MKEPNDYLPLLACGTLIVGALYGCYSWLRTIRENKEQVQIWKRIQISAEDNTAALNDIIFEGEELRKELLSLQARQEELIRRQQSYSSERRGNNAHQSNFANLPERLTNIGSHTNRSSVLPSSPDERIYEPTQIISVKSSIKKAVSQQYGRTNEIVGLIEETKITNAQMREVIRELKVTIAQLEQQSTNSISIFPS